MGEAPRIGELFSVVYHHDAKADEVGHVGEGEGDVAGAEDEE